jgi:toxin-antitoxin system PIN domain toxin
MLLDVNILVAAHRPDHAAHGVALGVVDGYCADGFDLCAHTCNGFLRLVTHSSLWRKSTPIEVALDTLSRWRARPSARVLIESKATWEHFDRLCRQLGARGNGVYDLHLASLAIAHDRVLISDDRGFDRIRGLRWRPPEAL